MYAILALGNPGNQYAKTRHNAGWIIADTLFPHENWHENKYAHAELAAVEIGATTCTIAKPLTFMNESGKTADYVYNLLKDKTYNTVIVISPSHAEYFPGITIYDGDA